MIRNLAAMLFRLARRMTAAAKRIRQARCPHGKPAAECCRQTPCPLRGDAV